jgi:type IV pilus assembly protein PilW
MNKSMPRQMTTCGCQRGLSLIELMVALTISAVLVLGAAQVYVDSRAAYNQNETVSRLQESARYALSVIETDARMANYWGLIQNSPPIVGTAPQNTAAAAVASTAAANYCGANLATDLTNYLQADNNQYLLSTSGTRTANCDTLSGWTTTAVGSADTLTVRHAALAQPAPAGTGISGTLQLCSTQSSAVLINGGVCPIAAVPPTIQAINNVIVNAYYVDQNSGPLTAQQTVGLPSLRRKFLATSGAAGVNGIIWRDQEIVPGIEDMQVEFGVDPLGNTGIATRYVEPNDPILAVPSTQVVAIRVWLLVRSDAPESGFIDNRVYAYGDRAVANGTTFNMGVAASARMAFAPNLDTNTGLTGLMHFRRLLVSRTIQIRNTYRIS